MRCNSYSLEENLSQELFFTMKTVIMVECDLLEVLKTEEIIAKMKTFLQEGCRCSHGTKGSQCCEQFSKEAVLSNLNNCLELSHGELDLVILVNVQACTNSETTGEKRKQSSRSSFLYLYLSDLQGYVLMSLRNKLFTISLIKVIPLFCIAHPYCV